MSNSNSDSNSTYYIYYSHRQYISESSQHFCLPQQRALACIIVRTWVLPYIVAPGVTLTGVLITLHWVCAPMRRASARASDL